MLEQQLHEDDPLPPTVFFFHPGVKKKSEKIFNIVPEKFKNWSSENLGTCQRRQSCVKEKNGNFRLEKSQKPSREKSCKIVPEKNTFQNI